MNENVIEWLSGEDTMSITAPNASRLKGKILKLAETNPDIEIVCINKDGSIFAHVPVKCLSLRNPMKLSDEQIEERAQRLRSSKIQASKTPKTAL